MVSITRSTSSNSDSPRIVVFRPDSLLLGQHLPDLLPRDRRCARPLRLQRDDDVYGRAGRALQRLLRVPRRPLRHHARRRVRPRRVPARADHH